MIKINPKVDELPFSAQALEKIAEILFSRVDIDKLKEEGIQEKENLFNKKDSTLIEDSFTIKYQWIFTTGEDEDKIDFYIEEIVLLESEDEFFEEYKRLKSLNDQ